MSTTQTFEPPCVIDGQQYVVAVWMSSAETAPLQTDTYITNATDGYLTRFEALGQASAAPGSMSLTADPYSTRLRPVTDLQRLYDAASVWLLSMRFEAFDVLAQDSAIQDAATLAALATSAGTDDAYVQSPYRNSLACGWQPNWFRPRLRVNGRDVLFPDASRSAFGAKSNSGDLSIGLSVPFSIKWDVWLGKVTELEVFAQVVQKVASKYVRYPVRAEAHFIIDSGA